jgi:hypothetical protein
MSYYALWITEDTQEPMISCFDDKETLQGWLSERSELRENVEFLFLSTEEYIVNQQPLLPDLLELILVIKGENIEPRPKKIEVKEWWIE